MRAARAAASRSRRSAKRAFVRRRELFVSRRCVSFINVGATRFGAARIRAGGGGGAAALRRRARGHVPSAGLSLDFLSPLTLATTTRRPLSHPGAPGLRREPSFTATLRLGFVDAVARSWACRLSYSDRRRKRPSPAPTFHAFEGPKLIERRQRSAPFSWTRPAAQARKGLSATVLARTRAAPSSLRVNAPPAEGRRPQEPSRSRLPVGRPGVVGARCCTRRAPPRRRGPSSATRSARNRFARIIPRCCCSSAARPSPRAGASLRRRGASFQHVAAPPVALFLRVERRLFLLARFLALLVVAALRGLGLVAPALRSAAARPSPRRARAGPARRPAAARPRAGGGPPRSSAAALGRRGRAGRRRRGGGGGGPAGRAPTRSAGARGGGGKRAPAGAAAPSSRLASRRSGGGPRRRPAPPRDRGRACLRRRRARGRGSGGIAVARLRRPPSLYRRFRGRRPPQRPGAAPRASSSTKDQA